ncbi:hypothetical protein CW713_06720 [Methanophagales archaeon]|nr:MAG: hypothetical protein CW713_06720 [Methanophagales archaeon]
MDQKITERTLYPFIGKTLEEIGFKNIQEISAGKGYIDIESFLNSFKLIIEVKIEDPHTKWKNLLEGVAQAWEYSKSASAMGFIVIEYPADVRRPLLFTPAVVEELANLSNVKAFVLTDFWTDRFVRITPLELFKKLKERADVFIIRKEKYVSLDLAIDTIREAILTISGVLRQYVGTIDDLINTIVGRFDLFLSLAEEKEEKLKIAAIDLSSYLLVNQILFYHVYASLTKKITDLDETKINSVFDLKEYFKKITDINYKTIYSIDVVSGLPDIDLIVENIKSVIRAIKGVRAASIRHDLIGRIYHESLPFETRKRLAAFYTKPVAAEILAGLCINKWDEKIIDPACGSGTLLVAAYRRKMDLYKERQGREELSIGEVEDLHNLFLKEQITGLDIMPFACHLTAVNLSAQNPHVTTNRLRIAVRDSLSLQEVIKSKEFKETGIILKPFSRILQETLVKSEIKKQTYFSRNGEIVKAEGVISPEGIGEEFLLYPSDVTIMNPPFSDREKMPADYRNKLKKFDKLTVKCGNQINLWGFFLALADDLIREGGKIGAVIPINIARGKASEKIRNYILENYHIKYIIKATKDLGFSEAAAFRDILFIAEKEKAKKENLVEIIFLKKSIKQISLDEAKKIAEKIRIIIPKGGDYIHFDESFELYFVKQSELEKNFMEAIWGFSLKNILLCKSFYEEIKRKGGKKLMKFPVKSLMEGFHTSPKGLSQVLFITDAFNRKRISRSLLIFEGEDHNSVYFRLKSINEVLRIEKDKVKKALKTIVGINGLDITKLNDYIILDNFNGLEKVLTLSKYKKNKINWGNVKEEARKKSTFITVFRRFSPSSSNVSLLSLYSEDAFIPTDAFKIFKCEDREIAKIFNLQLNSIVSLVKLLSNMQQTTGEFSDIKNTDFLSFEIIDPNQLSEEEKEAFLDLFEKLRNIKFPPIIEQLETQFWARVKLDRTILKVLGFTKEEISKWLPKVYNALVEEMKTIKGIR